MIYQTNFKAELSLQQSTFPLHKLIYTSNTKTLTVAFVVFQHSTP
jgi:hypothetical protein